MSDERFRLTAEEQTRLAELPELIRKAAEKASEASKVANAKAATRQGIGSLSIPEREKWTAELASLRGAYDVAQGELTRLMAEQECLNRIPHYGRD